MSDAKKTTKTDMLFEVLSSRVVGSALSELANYSVLFQNNPEPVFLLDRHSYRVLEANPAALQMLGQSESDVLGKTFFEHVAVQEPDLILSQSQVIEWEGINPHQRGSWILEIRSSFLPILDYLQVLQVIVRDVTDHRLASRELKLANEKLFQLSTTDELTGLKNVRFFKENLEQCFESRLESSFGVILFDVDHFKQFNDREGHPAGDAVLRKIGFLLKQHAKPSWIPCRYGGEEFVVLVKDTPEMQLKEEAENLRKLIAESSFDGGHRQPMGFVSVSVGVRFIGPKDHILNSIQIVEEADQALYQSKHLGRNTVSVFHPDHQKNAA